MYVRDALMFDHNLIVETHPFYPMLTPPMQTEFIEQLFDDFIKQFDHFIHQCEKGFRNELIIQMYTRRYNPNSEVIHFGQKFTKVYFISSGQIDLITNKGKHKFLQMSKGAVFGHYGVIFGLKSNIMWKTPLMTSELDHIIPKEDDP